MFELTNIRSDDRRALTRGETFLLDNPDPGVRIRPNEQLELAMRTGQGLMLTRESEICGLSLVYKFDTPPSGPVYSEIGTMRITANGHALQVLIAKFHLLQIWLEEYEAEPPSVFAVVADGTASAYNLREKVGMADWSPPRELAAVRGVAGVPFVETKKVLLAPRQSFVDAARDLRNWHQGDNIFRCPKGNETIRAEFGWFSPDVLNSI